MRLRSIRWKSFGTAPEFPEWQERGDLKHRLEAEGARVEAWMLTWRVKWIQP